MLTCKDNQLTVIGARYSEPFAEELSTLVKQLFTIDSEQRWFVQISQTKHTFLALGSLSQCH